MHELKVLKKHGFPFMVVLQNEIYAEHNGSPIGII